MTNIKAKCSICNKTIRVRGLHYEHGIYACEVCHAERTRREVKDEQ